MSDGHTGPRSVGEEAAEGSERNGSESSTARVALGHRPVISPRVGEPAERLDPELLERYRISPVPDISDAVGRLYTMDGRLRPLYEPMRRLVGVALTVKAPPGDNWAIYGALNRTRQDDVLIVDWQGYSDGCGSGVNGLIPAIRQGLAGVIVDGGWRDIGDLQALDFPIHGRGISPFSPSKRELGEINVPVCCGGVIVEPGDVVVADREGAVIVPRRHAAEVARSLPASAQRHATDGYSQDGLQSTHHGKIDDAYRESFEAHGGLQGDE